MKKYKYKREHFDSQEQYDSFKGKRTKWQKSWLDKFESANPEHKERRLLRQRLYSRYYHHTDCHQSFAEWLRETLHIDNIKAVSLERLKALVSKS